MLDYQDTFSTIVPLLCSRVTFLSVALYHGAYMQGKDTFFFRDVEWEMTTQSEKIYHCRMIDREHKRQHSM